MKATSLPIVLPDANAIRARIDELDYERKLLRQLLTTVFRIEARRPQTAPPILATASPPTQQREVAHVS